MVGVVQAQILRVAIDEVGVPDLNEQMQLTGALPEQQLKGAIVRRRRPEA